MATGITHTVNSTVTIDKSRIISNGTDHATVTVTLKDSAGTAVTGHTVTLAAIANGTNVTIPAASGVSDENGVVTFHPITATATHALTTKVMFQATDTTDEKVIAATVELATSPLTDEAVSTCVTDMAVVTADNTSLATITVTLKNAAGAVVPGHSVTISCTNNTGVTIATSPTVTDVNGQAVFTAKSTTIHASCVFTAVDATETVTVTQTATVAFKSSMSSNKSSVSFNAIKSNPNKMGSESQSVTLTCHPTTTGITLTKVGAASWLTVPATADSGVAFDVTVDKDALCKHPSVDDGLYTETLRASKTNYDSVDIAISVMVHRN